MDLQSLLKQKKKVLKPCSTVITNADGSKFEISDGQVRKMKQGIPFVVDNKPDMQVAQIMPGIFLSSQDPVVCLETLKKHKIHHILSLGVEPSVKFEGIGYNFFDLMDLPETNISETVKLCWQIIDEHKKNNILIHCNAGVSRSATIVISYLMKRENISYDEAYEKVKTVRNCIRPNEGFVKQLKCMNFDDN